MGGRKNRRHSVHSESSSAPPQTAKDVKHVLAEVMAGLHSGRLEPKIGSIMAYVGTALLKAIETADLAERIDVLEKSSKNDSRK